MAFGANENPIDHMGLWVSFSLFFVKKPSLSLLSGASPVWPALGYLGEEGRSPEVQDFVTMIERQGEWMPRSG